MDQQRTNALRTQVSEVALQVLKRNQLPLQNCWLPITFLVLISHFRPLKEIPGKSLKASLVRVKAEDSGKVKTVGVKRKQEVTGGMDLASISNQVNRQD